MEGRHTSNVISSVFSENNLMASSLVWTSVPLIYKYATDVQPISKSLVQPILNFHIIELDISVCDFGVVLPLFLNLQFRYGTWFSGLSDWITNVKYIKNVVTRCNFLNQQTNVAWFSNEVSKLYHSASVGQVYWLIGCGCISWRSESINLNIYGIQTLPVVSDRPHVYDHQLQLCYHVLLLL